MANLAINPNFETDPFVNYYTWKNPATGETGNATFSWATDQSYSATHSIKIVSTYSKSLSFSRWLSKASIVGAAAGKKYTASAYIKTSGAPNGAKFRITYWSGIPTGTTYIGALESTLVTGTPTTWTQKTLAGTAPANTKYIRIEFMLFGPGTTWFDNILIEETCVTPIIALQIPA